MNVYIADVALFHNSINKDFFKFMEWEICFLIIICVLHLWVTMHVTCSGDHTRLHYMAGLVFSRQVPCVQTAINVFRCGYIPGSAWVWHIGAGGGLPLRPRPGHADRRHGRHRRRRFSRCAYQRWPCSWSCTQGLVLQNYVSS